MRKTRTKLVAAGGGLLAVTCTAAALAQTRVLSPSEETQAVVNDAAEQLGIGPAELSDALKQALKNRVDAAVDAGRLTEEQGAGLTARIDANEVPLLGLGGRHDGGPGHFSGLDAAAAYLGLTEEELRTQLDEGQTLAEVAEEEGKAVDGLVDAMVAAAREKINQAVADGRLTEEQRTQILSTLEQRIAEKVNSGFCHRPGGPGRGGWGPPPDSESNSGSRASGSSTGMATAA